MTVKDVIDGFRESPEENPERDVYADTLFQEAIRISMELNNQYHTTEQICEIMGRLTGKRWMKVFGCSHRFTRILERTLRLAGMSLSIPAVIFRTREGLPLGTVH